MVRTRGPGLSASQKKELWKRWKRGQSMNDIARVFARQRGSIHWILSSTGGIEPPIRGRSHWVLSQSERAIGRPVLARKATERALAFHELGECRPFVSHPYPLVEVLECRTDPVDLGLHEDQLQVGETIEDTARDHLPERPAREERVLVGQGEDRRHATPFGNITSATTPWVSRSRMRLFRSHWESSPRSGWMLPASGLPVASAARSHSSKAPRYFFST